MISSEKMFLIDKVVKRYPSTLEGYHSVLNDLKRLWPKLWPDSNAFGQDEVESVIRLGKYDGMLEGNGR